MVMRNKTTNIYTEWLPLIDSLPNDIAGVIFKNILKYQNGEDINNTFPVWVFIKSKIDEYNDKGKQISEKRRESGRNGGLAKASKCQQVLAKDSKSSNKIKENKTKENNKPTLQEVIDYCNERGNGVDANKWYDYYTANGWRVGRNPMKDWRATVRTWERQTQPKKESVFEHNIRIMKEMEEENNANENLF